MSDITEGPQAVTIEIPQEAMLDATGLVQPEAQQISPENPQVEQIQESGISTEINNIQVEEPTHPTESTITTAPTEELIEKPKHAGGRPCEYCKDKDLIQSEVEKYYRRHEAALKNGKPIIPYYQELAIELGYDRDTINDWTDKKNKNNEPEHPELIRTIKRIKTLQEVLLLKRTLGRFNPTGAIFQLNTNHSYMTAEKRIVAGDKNEPLQIEIIEEKQHEIT